MTENSTKQSRYYDLRNRLSEVKYSGVFGIDSLDTVEELFNDLQVGRALEMPRDSVILTVHAVAPTNCPPPLPPDTP